MTGTMPVAEAEIFFGVGGFDVLFLAEVGDFDEAAFDEDRGVGIEGVGEMVHLEADAVVVLKDGSLAAGEGQADVEGTVEPAEGNGDGVGVAVGAGHAEAADEGVVEQSGDLWVGHGEHGESPGAISGLFYPQLLWGQPGGDGMDEWLMGGDWRRCETGRFGGGYIW